MARRVHDGRVTATRVATTSPEAFCIDRESTYLVENRTPYDIQIDRDAQRLIVPGLATRRMSGVRLQVFESELVPLRQRHQLRVTRHHTTSMWGTLFGLAAFFALMALPIMMIVRFLQDGTFLRSLTGVLLGATLLLGLLAISAWFIAEHRGTRQRDLDERADGDVAHGSSALLEPDTGMGRRIWNFAVLLVMITVGVLLPATWIYFGTELHKIVSFEDGLSVGAANAAEATWRSIQITYVAVLVTLPAMLYFLFDRVHINGLIHQWSRDIFRLDRRVETLADMQARYGHKLAEATRQSPSSTRLVGSKRSPIIVATLLFAVGWTLLILPTRSRDTSAEATTAVAEVAAERAEQAARQSAQTNDRQEQAEAAGAAAEAADLAQGAAEQVTGGILDEPSSDSSGGVAATPDAGSPVGESGPTTTVDLAEQAQADASEARAAATTAQVATQSKGSGTFQIFDPEPSAATAAFLGAYFFSLFAALRGFSRRDLRPKLYVAMAARVALTASIAFLIVVVTPWGEAPPMIALAFLAGVTPLPIISAVVFAPLKTLAHRAKSEQPAADHQDRMTSQVESALSNRRPLTVLDHIDLFEEARLEGEGITDTEALAHGEIVDLLVATRTPAGRLVDWVDQALLIIHIEQPSTAGDGDGRLGALRNLGLRTATDLVNASTKATVGRAAGSTDQAGELAAILGGESKLALIVDSIKAEPNYAFVDWWKKSPLGKPTADVKLVLGADGCLHDRPPMDEGGRCASFLGDTESSSGNGHRAASAQGSR
jgi:hypothetical protein